MVDQSRPLSVDRRSSPRVGVRRPVKLRCDRTGIRYLLGRTCNVSSSGALIELEAAPLLAAGQTVELAMAGDGPAGLLRAEHVVRASVVRSLGHDRHRYVALSFAQPVRLAQAG